MYRLRCYCGPYPTVHEELTVVESDNISTAEEYMHRTTRMRFKIDEDENAEYFALVSIIPVLVSKKSNEYSTEDTALFAVTIQRTYRDRTVGPEKHDVINCPAFMFVMRCGSTTTLLGRFGSLRAIEITRERVRFI